MLSLSPQFSFNHRTHCSTCRSHFLTCTIFLRRLFSCACLLPTRFNSTPQLSTPQLTLSPLCLFDCVLARDLCSFFNCSFFQLSNMSDSNQGSQGSAGADGNRKRPASPLPPPSSLPPLPPFSPEVSRLLAHSFSGASSLLTNFGHTTIYINVYPANTAHNEPTPPPPAPNAAAAASPALEVRDSVSVRQETPEPPPLQQSP